MRDQIALREIGPMGFDERKSGDIAGLRIGRGVVAGIKTEELAVRLEAAGFDVGQIVGEHFERFHAGAHTAGGRS